MFLFDRKQKIIKWLTDQDFIEATLTERINTSSEIKFSVPLNKRLSSEVVYVAVPNPRGEQASQTLGYVLCKIIAETVQSDRVEYQTIEAAYDELKSYHYIKDVRPQDQTATQMLARALEDTRWVPGLTYDRGTASTNFYYISTLEAIQKIINLFSFEVTFSVIIDPLTNQITKRQVNIFPQMGDPSGKRFEYGSNLLEVTQEQATDSLVTALIGHGKGEQVSEGTDGSPDGYGRRINFADIVWKKSNGNPTDKPAGQEYVEDKDATALFGFDDGSPRIGYQEFDDITDRNELIQATWASLQVLKRPQVSFKASVIDVGDLNLGDTVAIVRHDLHIEYQTRVFKVEHNLLNIRLSTVELGDDLSKNSTSSALSSIQSSVQIVSSTANYAATAANGKNTNNYGSVQPSNPIEGDLWYKDLGNGQTDLMRYHNGAWILIATTRDVDNNKKAIEKAKQDFQEGFDQLKVKDSDLQKEIDDRASAINTSISQAKQDFQNGFNSLQVKDNDLQSQINTKTKAINDSIASEKSAFDAKFSAADNLHNQYATNFVNLNNQVSANKTAAQNAQASADRAQRSADGKNIIYYGPNQPSGAKNGDTWFKDMGDNSIVAYVYNNGSWKQTFDTSQTAVMVLTTGQDLNNLTESHLYFIQSTANTNTPEGKNNWCYVDVKKASDSRITQTWIADNDQKMAYQRIYTGTWSPWSRTVTNDDVIALINASQERTVIDGSKLHVTGRTLIDNGVINNAMIANLDAGKITSGTISADRIGANSIAGNKLAANTITGDKIASGTISGDLIKAGSISTDKLISGKISGSVIQAGTLDVGALKAGTIDATKITLTNLNASNINSGTLSAQYIKGHSIGTDQLVTSGVSADIITTGKLNASLITTGTLDATKITVKGLSASSISSGTLDAQYLKANSIGADKLVTSGLNASAITTGKLNADLITTGTLDAGKLSVINVNAKSITAGSLKGPNMELNLDTGYFKTTQGSNSAVIIESGGVSAYNIAGKSSVVMKDGSIKFSKSTGTASGLADDYGVIDKESYGQIGSFGMSFRGTDGVTMATKDWNYDPVLETNGIYNFRGAGITETKSANGDSGTLRLSAPTIQLMFGKKYTKNGMSLRGKIELEPGIDYLNGNADISLINISTTRFEIDNIVDYNHFYFHEDSIQLSFGKKSAGVLIDNDKTMLSSTSGNNITRDLLVRNI